MKFILKSVNIIVSLILVFSVQTLFGQSSTITISDEYPQYWEYNGEPTVLLGGSVEDNLFQIEEITKELKLLQYVGGNYVRNTMSSRDEGNVWPFAKNGDGNYNLNQWNQEYWRRFENFLKETSKRDIIVQIEIWATFDFYRDNWDVNPYNPKNNVNYGVQRSKLPLKVDSHPVYTENNFFRSVPSKMNLAPVLWYQKLFVDKILSYSLDYGNVLYCMDNETSVTSDWGKFWANYIQKQAKLQGKTVQTTEMWDAHDLSHPMHFETFDNPEIFTFVDISQNNHQSGQNHWDNGLKQIEYLKSMGYLRPVNNVKIYGDDEGRHQTTRNAIESFIRNVLFGSASARFHRPTSGQGLNQIAQNTIRSMRNVIDETDFYNAQPHNDLLSDRSENEAFCRAIPGEEYIVYFPNGGEVTLDTAGMSGRKEVRWLLVLHSKWAETERVRVGGDVQLRPPDDGHWIALIQ
ncbi:MAG: hypothetical protein GF372_06110 [Candidatus Marinimicrobia bacterium]|nr:hypothetical protein [Candidatus Neomarinimicrobiota bacterium]